jgi:hypothetical protein
LLLELEAVVEFLVVVVELVDIEQALEHQVAEHLQKQN